MLSIGAMAAGQEAYYSHLAREDYYLQGGEPPGRWWGKGAQALGLAGEVSARDLTRLLRGRSPTGKALVRNPGDRQRQPGWDLTFSAPKSVSVLWSQASRHVQIQIQQAHDAAVQAGLAYLQNEAGFSRIGKGGHTQVAAGLIVATFEHGTSRAQDPQLHTHSLVVNACVREDGTTGTIVSKTLYQQKMAAGVIYRIELAAQLERRLGVVVERDESSFRLRDIPRTIDEHFSKRRAAIEQRLASKGIETASAAAFATLSTREPKELVAPRNELFATWRAEGRVLGISPQHIEGLFQKAPRRDLKDEFRLAFQQALKTLTDSESYFNKSDLVRRTAEASQGRGLDSGAVIAGVERELHRSRDLVHLGDHLYTTAEMYALEDRLYEVAEKLKSSKRHGVSGDIVEKLVEHYSKPRSAVIEEARHHAEQFRRAARNEDTSRIDRAAIRDDAKKTFFDEQTVALRHVTASGGSIRFVSGVAGAGKTFMLKAAREAFEREGYTVLGAALAGKTAQQLERSTGITSMTLARLELLMQPRSFKDSAAHEIKQVGRTLAGKRQQPEPETKLPRIDLTLGDVLKHEIKQLGRALIKKPRISLGPSSVQWRKAGFRDQLAHEAQQVVRTMFGKKRTRMPKWIAEQRKHPLNNKTVLVVDEAGMIGTKQFTRLLDAAHKTGAMVIFVGDGRQLPALEAGSPFSALMKVSPFAELKEILRQKDSRDREVVLKASRGEARSILKDFAERGQLTVAPNRAEAMHALVRDWAVGHGARPETAAILCGTRAEAAELNRMCQNARLNSIASTGSSITCGDEKFYRGDRVMFTRNSKVLGVNNGDTGTVLTLKNRPSSITVKLDKGGRVSVSLKDYEHVQLGYAFTTHKLQGATVSGAYVLAGGRMQDREMTYTQLSRATGNTRIYTDANEAGGDLANLAKQMSTSKMKRMARDVAKAPWQPLPQIHR